MEIGELKNMDLIDIVANAVISEDDASEFYSVLAGRIAEGLTKDKFLYLSQQETMHKKILLDLYNDLFGTREIKNPKKRISFECNKNVNILNTISDLKTLIEALDLAMECERKAESLYRALIKKTDEKYAKNVFRYLAEMEHSHYIALKTEYSYYQRVEEAPEKYEKVSKVVNLKFA